MDKKTRKKPNCGELTWQAKGSKPLKVKEVRDNYEFWEFIQPWIRNSRSYNEMEGFIYLWVSFNAWASLAVPDLTKNHMDIYIVHSVSVDNKFKAEFEKQKKENEKFSSSLEEFVSLMPVLQVLWLKNNNVRGWGFDEDRKKYLKMVGRKNPYVTVNDNEKSMFSPACAYQHFDIDEDIPADWPHVMAAIYQVRCNLFHGGKAYYPEDRKFVELAYELLWGVWKSLIPRRFRE